MAGPPFCRAAMKMSCSFSGHLLHGAAVLQCGIGPRAAQTFLPIVRGTRFIHGWVLIGAGMKGSYTAGGRPVKKKSAADRELILREDRPGRGSPGPPPPRDSSYEGGEFSLRFPSLFGIPW